MKELTKAEEQVMQLLWNLEKAFVKDILEQFPHPQPAYNTVSTIVRILETKGFIAHNAYGKTHHYYPIVSKKDYTKATTDKLVQNYFGGSFKKMVSFFLEEKKLDIKELDEALKLIEEQKDKK